MKQFFSALPLSLAMGLLAIVVGANASGEFTIIIFSTTALLALIIMFVLPSSDHIRGSGLGTLTPMLLLAALSATGSQATIVLFAVSSLLSLVIKIAFDTSVSLEAAYLRGLADAREGHQFTENQVKAMFKCWNETKPVKWNGNSRSGQVTGKAAIAMIINAETAGQKVRQAEGLFIQWQQMKARGGYQYVEQQ